MGESFSLTTGSDMSKPDFVGESGDDFVAASREFDGDAVFSITKAREDQ